LSVIYRIVEFSYNYLILLLLLLTFLDAVRSVTDLPGRRCECHTGTSRLVESFVRLLTVTKWAFRLPLVSRWIWNDLPPTWRL